MSQPVSGSESISQSASQCPPRHFRRSTRRGERMPNGNVKQLQYSYAETPVRRNARDPSYRTPSTRSPRISRIAGKSNVFRPDHAYFLLPRRLCGHVTPNPPQGPISFANMCIIRPKTPRARARNEISTSDGRNPLLARNVLQKMTYCKTRARTRIFDGFAPFAKRYTQR